MCHRTNTCDGVGDGMVIVSTGVDAVDGDVADADGEQGSALIAFGECGECGEDVLSSLHIPTLASIRSPPGRIANTQWLALSKT